MGQLSREEKNKRAREYYQSMTPEQKEARLNKRKEWTRNNKEKVRAYNQSIKLSPEKCAKKKAAQKLYNETEKGKQIIARYRSTYVHKRTPEAKEAARKYSIIYQREWAKQNPQKLSAHRKVVYALRKGRLVKMPCEVCETLPVVAHHDDYSKPLDVRWLCQKHHTEIHCEPRRRELREKKQKKED